MKLLILVFFLTSCVTFVKPKECKGTKMVGWYSPESMTSRELEDYGAAKRRCKTLKKGRSPCLVLFEKVPYVGENAYHAVCGQPREID